MSFAGSTFVRSVLILGSSAFILAPAVLAQNSNSATEQIAARPAVVADAPAEQFPCRGWCSFNGAILKDGAARTVAGPASVTFTRSTPNRKAARRSGVKRAECARGCERALQCGAWRGDDRVDFRRNFSGRVNRGGSEWRLRDRQKCRARCWRACPTR